MRGGVPDKPLYACDGLRLNLRGVRLLQKVWRNKLALIPGFVHRGAYGIQGC